MIVNVFLATIAQSIIYLNYFVWPYKRILNVTYIIFHVKGIIVHFNKAHQFHGKHFKQSLSAKNIQTNSFMYLCRWTITTTSTIFHRTHVVVCSNIACQFRTVLTNETLLNCTLIQNCTLYQNRLNVPAPCRTFRFQHRTCYDKP